MNYHLIRFFLKSLKLLKPFVVIEKSIPALSKKKKLDGANSQCFNWERLRLLFLKGSIPGSKNTEVLVKKSVKNIKKLTMSEKIAEIERLKKIPDKKKK